MGSGEGPRAYLLPGETPVFQHPSVAVNIVQSIGSNEVRAGSGKLFKDPQQLRLGALLITDRRIVLLGQRDKGEFRGHRVANFEVIFDFPLAVEEVGLRRPDLLRIEKESRPFRMAAGGEAFGALSNLRLLTEAKLLSSEIRGAFGRSKGFVTSGFSISTQEQLIWSGNPDVDLNKSTTAWVRGGTWTPTRHLYTVGFNAEPSLYQAIADFLAPRAIRSEALLSDIAAYERYPTRAPPKSPPPPPTSASPAPPPPPPPP